MSDKERPARKPKPAPKGKAKAKPGAESQAAPEAAPEATPDTIPEAIDAAADATPVADSEVRPSPSPARAPKAAAAPPKRPRIGTAYTGVYSGNARRGAFVVPEAPGHQDIFIPGDFAGQALHGDQVRAVVIREGRGQLMEGRVEKVLKHANKQIVGKLSRSGKRSYVTPRNARIDRIVEIPRAIRPDEAADGSWVVVEVRTWSNSPGEPLIGKLIEVLGTEDDERLPILLLIREKGMRAEFPDEVEAEAEEIRKRGVTDKEKLRRRDLRGERVCTIDPATAKDFDDAVNLFGKTQAGGWRIGVHIADVGHYVAIGSKIDQEGYQRATSVYPVDRVIPMLPEALSNDLCSLVSNQDRLTMSAIFTVGRDGRVDGVDLCESVIHSVRRFNYEEVQALFDEADGTPERFPLPDIAAELQHDVAELRAAARALLKARMARGALDLDLPEMEILFDPEGRVRDVRRKNRLESHRLIEEFMLAANEAVARELDRRQMPTLFRVHEAPNEVKLEALAPAFSRFGLSFPRAGSLTPQALQAAIDKARNHPAGEIVQRLILRSMMRAHYQPNNVGHYGLASECYLHFTSPIRRYPDLVVHRGMKALLGSTDVPRDYGDTVADVMEEWGRHTSDRERRAQQAEWDAQKMLSYEFMRRHLGDVFEGYIGGFLPKGFFVELKEYPIEGFVPVRNLSDDYYDLDDKGLAFHGRATGRVYALGDPVRVQIERIDVLAAEMDLKLLGVGQAGGESGEFGDGARRKGKGGKGGIGKGGAGQRGPGPRGGLPKGGPGKSHGGMRGLAAKAGKPGRGKKKGGR